MQEALLTLHYYPDGGGLPFAHGYRGEISARAG